MFRGITAFKPALTRLMCFGDAHYQQALAARETPCLGCGRQFPLQFGPPTYRGDLSALYGTRGVHTFCDVCLTCTDICLKGVALWSARGRRFWQHQQRIRALPEREIVVEGRPAIVVTYQSVRDDAVLEVLFDQDTYRIVGAHTTTARPLAVEVDAAARADA